MTPFVLAFGTALRDVPDPCPWCGAAREYHPTSGGSNRTHPDGCAFFAIHHEHNKAVAALSARVAKLEAALLECRDLISRRMVAKGVNREQQAAQRTEARIVLARSGAALEADQGGARVATAATPPESTGTASHPTLPTAALEDPK